MMCTVLGSPANGPVTPGEAAPRDRGLWPNRELTEDIRLGLVEMATQHLESGYGDGESGD